MNLLSRLADLMFAPQCAACDLALPRSAPLCPPCAESLYPLGTACPRCADPIAGPVALVCRSCRQRPPPFDAITCPYRFGGELATALRRLKYGNRADIARALAPLIRPTLTRIADRVDVVVPMPLHPRRLRQRRFNHARLLLECARPPGMRVEGTLLLRRRDTVAQAGLSAAARRHNVAGAFAVTRRGHATIAGLRVALVDDVVTTGATMAAAARALKGAGARAVIGLAAARAEPR